MGAFDDDVRFIALDENEWLKEKQEYVKNLKAKYKYEIIEEPVTKQEAKTENESEIENVASNIFSRDKIEIV